MRTERLARKLAQESKPIERSGSPVNISAERYRARPRRVCEDALNNVGINKLARGKILPSREPLEIGILQGKLVHPVRADKHYQTIAVDDIGRLRARAFERDRLQPLAELGAEPFAADITDASTLASAFGGAQAAYLMLPPDVRSENVLAQAERSAFLSSCSYLLGMVMSAAFGLYPYVLPARGGPALSLCIYNTRTSNRGLELGLSWWIVGMILVMAYSTFLYRRFAGKVRPSEIPHQECRGGLS